MVVEAIEALEVIEIHPQDVEEGLDERARARQQIKAPTPQKF